MAIVTPERWYILFWLALSASVIAVGARVALWVLDHYFTRRPGW